MERIQHDLLQGTEAWQQFRMEHDGASEAAAMLGLSTTMTRNELLRLKHTGIAKEFCDYVQKHVLDYGHEVEAKARPIVEAMIEEDLYPVTFSYGQMSASCDGLTMDELTAFEHKQWNKELAASVTRGELPEANMPQCQQIMRVTGAQKVIFVCSDGTEENFVCMDVLPDPSWFARIEAGWKQFHEDLRNYIVEEIVVAPTAAPILALPAVSVQVNGALAVVSNLDAFGARLTAFCESIKTKPETDQDFVDLKASIKVLEKAEEALLAAQAGALEQVVEVAEMQRLVGMYHNLARTTRLATEKLVKAETENRKVAIQQAGKYAIAEHFTALNTRLGKPYMPLVPSDIPGVCRGLSSFDSMKNKVDTEVARWKIEANAIAQRIQLNLASLTELASDHKFLFADTAQLVLKQNDDLVALVKTRIAEHQAAEAKRLDAEREKIRAEEQAKAEKEAAAKLKAEQDALETKSREEERARQLATAIPAQTPASEPVTLRQVLHSAAPAPVAEAISPSAPPTLTIGNIGKRLGFDVRADFLRLLGFEGHKERAATLYHESDYTRICAALIAHIQNASTLRAAA